MSRRKVAAAQGIFRHEALEEHKGHEVQDVAERSIARGRVRFSIAPQGGAKTARIEANLGHESKRPFVSFVFFVSVVFKTSPDALTPTARTRKPQPGPQLRNSK